MRGKRVALWNRNIKKYSPKRKKVRAGPVKNKKEKGGATKCKKKEGSLEVIRVKGVGAGVHGK